MTIIHALVSSEFMHSVIRLASPIVFAMLSAVISKKSGVVNIATDGMMLICALSSVLVSAYTQSLVITFISALVIGGFFGLIFILIIIKLDANEVLTGLAFNIFALAATTFTLWLITGDKGASTSLKSLKMPLIELPIIKDIPYIGNAISNQNLLTYVAAICVVLFHILINKTIFGLRLKAVGEDITTARSVGINVDKMRIISLVLSGAMAGLGGTFMSMAYVSWFSSNMIAGRGFLGLIIEAMARGNLVIGYLVSLIFGYTDALSTYLMTSINLSPDLIRMLPYVFAIVVFSISGFIIDKRKKLKNKEIN